MTWTANSCFVTLAILFLWRGEEVAEACRCFPAHPQEVFCRSDVVMRGKVVGVQEVDAVNDIYGNPTKYDIKQIKMFKGPSNGIDALYTNIFLSCGVILNNGTEYLITGELNDDGMMYIGLCDFIKPWDKLSETQKSLTQRYERGCGCKFTFCFTTPCIVSSPAECMWTDSLIDNQMYGGQAKHLVCMKRSDGSCAWYRGPH
ncbi:metalloproteinase inhibitor 2-like [Trematomus bernacchii]|uniref:metalloproteinase inhibitor 2-like n=1 Tax=Trematomus bernacchii TaxID=40690 RepID=UPI00146B90A3|nr:metalloproteinase inhibitor 2-like [Trematomus bernacchii]